MFVFLKPQIRLGTSVLGTSVLKYQFCINRQYSVLILFKNESNLTNTYEYFTGIIHLKLIQNNVFFFIIFKLVQFSTLTDNKVHHFTT